MPYKKYILKKYLAVCINYYNKCLILYNTNSVLPFFNPWTNFPFSPRRKQDYCRRFYKSLFR